MDAVLAPTKVGSGQAKAASDMSRSSSWVAW